MLRSGTAAVALAVAVAACAADDAATSVGETTADTGPITTASAATTAAAGGDSTADGADDTRPPATSAMPTPSDPTPGGSTTVPGPPVSAAEPLYAPGDIDAGLQPFIDQAAADLAARLAVDRDQISTHAAVLVVWPDTSLGCPQPDMSYAQVLTDGSVIELEHAGDVYRYHTGGERGPFICEQPITKAPPGEPLSAGDGAED